jgi:hypothetical protein
VGRIIQPGGPRVGNPMAYINIQLAHFSTMKMEAEMYSKIYVNNCPTRCNNIQFIYICKPLYMFRVVTPLIIRSSYHCTCSIWHYRDRTATCLERDSMRTSNTSNIKYSKILVPIYLPNYTASHARRQLLLIKCKL